MTSPLFSEYKFGAVTVKNRLLMAPMTRNRAGAGNVPTDLMAKYYVQRASAGLLITEATQVMPEGVGYPNTPGIHSEEQVGGWKKVTDAVHQAGGKIFLQLWHVGRISHSLFQPGGKAPVSSSAIAPQGKVFTPEGLKLFETPRALELKELPGVVEAYKKGTANAKRAGFDGVEIHAANGYLIDQFLQDGVNHRTDEYGGSLENRLRFLKEVTEAVLSAWDAGHVGVRLSPNGSFNDMSDSNPKETFSAAIKLLDQYGLAYLHLRQGAPSDAKRRVPVPIETFRPLFHGPIVLNDGFTRPLAEEALAQNKGDAFAMGTAFLANPDLPKRWEQNAPLNTPDPRTFYGGAEKGYTDYPFL